MEEKLPKDYIVGIRYQFILILSGLLFGHFIWSQRHEEFIKFYSKYLISYAKY